MNCKDCNYKVFEKSNGSPNRYYCKHPEALKGVGARLICRTKRHSEEVTIKTAPRWCPLKQVCRVCGCTWYDPCQGGCYWTEPDLCSRCACELKNGIFENPEDGKIEAWKDNKKIGSISAGCDKSVISVWKERYKRYIVTIGKDVQHENESNRL